ncbi:DNA mismatch repair protein MutS [Streptobacillus felis]|uniref:DNA mismatch repair protein MutS n=2 Tax=Streptobacillus felis TaxID=1384509 RepID=A0A7Z0PDY0_9FUSO|nr:DNA mismatch repair protein MutS [Streptobacillus felis]NYV27489.1 DNA mismatch repair protein MutS [Streptobacillus felis]
MSTPLMKQYTEIKGQYKEYILFFRLGDFYEMFFEDAEIASRVLGLTLTSRNKEKGMDVPLAGIPYHSSKPYIAKLVNAGYKVAICEQTEDPKKAKGIVKREVVQIITSGTLQDVDYLDSKSNNYLACIEHYNQEYSLSYLDITTGEFKVLECNEDNLISEIYKIEPSEILLTQSIKERLSNLIEKLDVNFSIITKINDGEKLLKDYFNIVSLDSYGIYGKKAMIDACASILDYVLAMQFNNELTIRKIEVINKSEVVEISSSTLRNLEIIKNQRDKSTYGSLLWVLDKCKSSTGSRKLKQLLQNPLLDIDEINRRYDDVEYLCVEIIKREEIRSLLDSVYDIERLIGKVIFSNENGKDINALKKTIYSSFKIKELWPEKFVDIDFNILANIYRKIDELLLEDAPFSVREGNMIKSGVSSELDELRNIMNNGTSILLEIEAREREKTGIKNLKIKYNNVFGYFIEVSKSNLDMVPETYIRKQTLSNAERFITEEIKSYEDKIINSKAKIAELEYNIFKELSSFIKEYKNIFIELSNVLAYIDILISFTITALENNYTRPKFNDNYYEIKDARHPVVERLIGDNTFISNNVYFDNDNKFIILTGPNMSGKSTYMKQIALISIMAQIGSFVPAKEANLNIVDKILTRIGASDDILSGQSTFMVEMSEVAGIINSATNNSLIILDEVGRGTSTYDGLAIASSISKYIVENIDAKAIFATHYHELTELENEYTSIKNYRIEVEEKNGKVNFLRTIVKGGADRSYGIEVAKLAGLPKSIIRESTKLLKSFESEKNNGQLSLFNNFEYENYDKIEKLEETIDVLNEKLEKIRSLDINNMTPLEALNTLMKIKGEI